MRHLQLLACAAHLVCFLGAVEAAEVLGRPYRVDVEVGVSSVPRGSGREALNSDPVLGLALGVALDERWSVELFHRSLSLVAGLLSADYTPQTHTGISLRGSLPLGASTQFQGRLGIGRTKSTSDFGSQGDKHETDPSLGVGLAYDFSAAWSAQLSTTRFTKSKVTTTLAGFEFRF